MRLLWLCSTLPLLGQLQLSDVNNGSIWCIPAMGALRPSFRQCGKITTQKDNFTCLHWNMEFSTEVHNAKAWIVCLFSQKIDPTEQAASARPCSVSSQ